jgi:D-3-phosphoglycerate dehydrogenase
LTASPVAPLTIVIPDDYQDAVRTLDCFGKLSAHKVIIYNTSADDISALADRLDDADALVLIRERTPITNELLNWLPKLKFIAQTGRGAPHIDLEACTRRGIAVSVGDGTPYATAELTWGLVLAAMRRIPQEVEGLKAGKWQTSSPLGLGLRGRTLGIYSYGKIGSVVAGYGRAFGMKVVAWGREGSLRRAEADGYEAATSREDFFSRADVLCLHLKMLPETEGIVTAADLALMKPSALLVNTSRAALIAPGALETALRAGRPGFAAVDVYEDEPVRDHPLLHLPNVICTPHLGYVEKDSYEQYFGTAFDHILAFAAGAPTGVINPAAFDHK